MKIVLLALDQARAARAVAGTAEHVRPEDSLWVIASAPVDGARTLVPRHLPRPYSPDTSLLLADRLRRTARLYVAGHAVWRALRRDREVARLVLGADLVVLGDEVSLRSAWNIARRTGVTCWGRIATIPYARRLLGA
ncbi:MAG TPA: hypothetical protein VFC82_05920 [Actinomycetaceae bacterium]|nr:hypothetical protein [Actinomycetaceae bacterium]